MPEARGSTAREAPAEPARIRFVRRLRRLLFRYPGATQAAFAALVAEGRRYAETPEGARLAESLSRSDLVARARVVWEVVGMTAFVEGQSSLPSVVVDEFARVAASDGIERALARALEGAE